MSITAFFRRQDLVYISIDTEGAERRDARPFVSIDTNEPRKAEPFMAFSTDMPRVKPLEANTEFEIYEQDTSRGTIDVAAELEEIVARGGIEKVESETEEIEAESEAEEIEIESEAEEMPVALELPKLLKAGKTPILLEAPVITEIQEDSKEIEDVLEPVEAWRVIYFSNLEMMDGAETITESEASPMRVEKKSNFIGAKIVALLVLLIGLTTILFPSVSLNAAKMQINVNPTNTTPGLSLAISNNDMLVTTDPVTSKQSGELGITTMADTLVTSTLDLDVSTTGADGYKLYMTTSGTDKKGDYTNALVNKNINANNGEGAKIDALSADTTMSAFPAGRWGYTTATSLQNNTTFKTFPIYDSTDTVKYGGTEIASANTAIADNDPAGETPFTIGIKADNALPAGDYKNDLLFTIIVNPVSITYNLNFDGDTTDSSLAGVPSTITETSADVFKNIAIPNATPTRDDYIFKGWADTSGATTPDYIYGDATKGAVTLQVTDINNSQVVNKTVYAVWEKKDYLQDFDADTELLDPGDSRMLYDKRDNKTYTVKRLADGKVWMTQNLAYEATATQVSTTPGYGAYYTWANAKNSCPANWRLPTGGPSGEFAQLDRAYGFSGEDRTDNVGMTEYLSTTSDYPGIVPAGYINDDGDLEGAGWVGNFWAAENAKTYFHLNTVNQAIYPAYVHMQGDITWSYLVRCVTGEEPKRYLQDFNDVIDLRTVGNTDTFYDKRDGKDYIIERLADGKVWMMDDLRYVGDAADPGYNTSNVTTFSVDTTLSQGTGTINRRGSFATSSYTEMQMLYAPSNLPDMAYYSWAAANVICPAGWHLPSRSEYAALATNYPSASGNPLNVVLSGYLQGGATLKGSTSTFYWTTDEQNSTSAYNVNGVTPSSYSAFNTSIGSIKYDGFPVRCVGDQPNTFYIQDFDDLTMLPNTGDSAVLTDRRDSKTYMVKRLADGKVWMTQNLNYATGAYATDNTYGGYYTWESAQNVCPANWHLPTAGANSEYANLDKAYGGTGVNRVSATNFSALVSAFSVAPYPGAYDGSTIYFRGSSAYFWSTTRGKTLYLTSSDSGIYPDGGLGADTTKTSVRCTADTDAKITFDANGGTGTMAVQSFVRGVRQALSTNTFTRDGYNFLGWAATADATTPKYTDGQSATFTKSTKLYAVWGANYIQDFDSETQLLNVGDSTTLVDKRDGRSYTIKRLPDGKVWMTQNLALGMDATSVGITLTEDDTNIDDGKTYYLPPAGKQGSSTIDDASTLTATTAVNFNTTVDNRSKTIFRTKNSSIVNDSDTGYYNFYTATLGFSSYYDSKSAGSSSRDICPKGWHLPRISATSTTTTGSRDFTGDFAKLADLYNPNAGWADWATGNRYTPDATVRAGMHTGAVADSNNLGLSYAGYYNAASLGGAGTNGAYWTSSIYDVGSGYSLNFDTTNDYPQYNNSKSLAYAVRCIADYEERTVSLNANGGSGTMAAQTVVSGQSLTLPTNTYTRTDYTFLGWATSATADTAEYTNGQTITVTSDMTLYAVWQGTRMQTFSCAKLAPGSTMVLSDIRDNQNYQVYRIPLDAGDSMAGNCIMQKDLSLGYVTGGSVTRYGNLILTAENSAAAGAIIAKDGTNWSDNSAELQYRIGEGTANNDSSYYSYEAAQKVCPKGWSLPSRAQYIDLVTLAGGNGATGVTNITDASGPYKYHLGGLYNRFNTVNGPWINKGGKGYYWAADPSTSNVEYAYYLIVSNDSQQVLLAVPQDGTRWLGFTVRCVAGYKEDTVSFNANGGAGTTASQTVAHGQNVTLTNNFTREGYDFLGWSEDASATTATYTNGQVIALTSDKTLYAVWQDQNDFFQGADSCANIPIGSTGTLIDVRDGQNYSVYRFSRSSAPSGFAGTCIMTQDLALGYTTGGNVTKGSNLTLTTSDSAGADTITARTGTSDWVEANENANLQYINGTGGSNDAHSYYSYGAAQSVCPKGWRLPSYDEYNNIIAFVGSGSAGSSTMQNATYNFEYSGFFYKSGWNNVGISGRYWTSSQYTDASGYHMYFTASSLAVSRYNKNYGLAVRCVADYEEKTVSFNANGGSGTMASQIVGKGRSITIPANAFTRANYTFLGWATSATADTAEYTSGQTITVTDDMTLYAVWDAQITLLQTNNSCAAITKGTTGSLMDSRDDRVYSVYRFTDNNAPSGLEGDCIMAQDLALGYTTGGFTTRGGDLTLDTGSSVAAGTILAKTTANNWTTTNADSNMQYINGTSAVRSYYSYGAAQAVCPKGWRLPTKAEYGNIATFAGGNNATGSAFIRNTPYNFNYGGGFNNTDGWNSVNTAGYYWSSTQSNSTNGYFLYLAASNLHANNSNVKNVGRSVRCIAITDKTVSFNANGGTGTMASQTVAQGASLTLSTNTMTRTGYNFLGWSEDASATTATYADGATVTVDKDIALYAVWLDQSMVRINSYTYTTAIQNESAEWTAARNTCSNLAPAGSWSLPTKAQLQDAINTTEGKALVYNTWGAGRLWTITQGTSGEGGARYYYLNITSATQATFSTAYTYGTYRVVCVQN